jgi:hypothetical protein
MFSLTYIVISQRSGLKDFTEMRYFPALTAVRKLVVMGPGHLLVGLLLAVPGMKNMRDTDPRRTELSYLLKYVDKRDNAKPGSDPWSIRHALVYQKVSRDQSRLSHILIRLPAAVKRVLGSSLLHPSDKSSVFVEDWTHLHTACFGSIDVNMRHLINYLDEEVDHLVIDLAGYNDFKLKFRSSSVSSWLVWNPIISMSLTLFKAQPVTLKRFRISLISFEGFQTSSSLIS